MIININSIKDIEKGWLIKMSEKGEINYNKFKNQKLITIGVIGNCYKGKSFILSKIILRDISPPDSYIKTEGLSIRYSELGQHRIVALDSAGLDTPILNEREEDNKNKGNNEGNNLDERKNKRENIPELVPNNSKQQKEIDDKEIFEDKLREKFVTKLFLQNYIINNSELLLIVVGKLTFSEQKLLHRIKIASQKIRKRLFIIHNLKEFIKIKQVKNYIKKYLKNNSTFKLEEGHKISASIDKINGCYFYEENSEVPIFHFIFAKEGSEAGYFFNNFTRNQIIRFSITARDHPFDFIQSIKESFIEFSPWFLENGYEERLAIDDFISNDEIIKNKIIKLKKPKSLNIKKFLDMGRGRVISKGISVNYNIFKKDNELIIRVEMPGNCDIKSFNYYDGEYIHLKIEGMKRRDKVPYQDNENIISTREYGEFYLDIPIKIKDFSIKNFPPKISNKDGIFIFIYELEQKNNEIKFKNEDEDDI